MRLTIIRFAGVLACLSFFTGSARAVTVTCIGPQVDKVIPGNWQRGVPDKVIGATPDILAGPGGRPTGRRLPAGGAYLADKTVAGFYHLIGTHYSSPFSFGSAVGWVSQHDMHALALRNCN
jgi:hypothetical protein